MSNKEHLQLCPTWVVQKRHKSLEDRKFLMLLEQFISEKELDDDIIGPVVEPSPFGSVIKLKSSRRTARILTKAPGVIRLTTTSEVI